MYFNLRSTLTLGFIWGYSFYLYSFYLRVLFPVHVHLKLYRRVVSLVAKQLFFGPKLISVYIQFLYQLTKRVDLPLNIYFPYPFHTQLTKSVPLNIFFLYQLTKRVPPR